MKKVTSEKNTNKEFWFTWLTRKLNSYQALDHFSESENPKDIAEKFIYLNQSSILEVIHKFDNEDNETLDHFQKLIECEWHVFRLLKKELESIKKVKYVDFRKAKINKP